MHVCVCGCVCMYACMCVSVSVLTVSYNIYIGTCPVRHFFTHPLDQPRPSPIPPPPFIPHPPTDGDAQAPLHGRGPGGGVRGWWARGGGGDAGPRHRHRPRGDPRPGGLGERGVCGCVGVYIYVCVWVCACVRACGVRSQQIINVLSHVRACVVFFFFFQEK